MTKQDLIAALLANARLGTPEQVAAFDRALHGLVQDRSLTPPDLSALFTVFDDACENEEVMFGLVHLVEDFALEDFLRGFIAAVGDLDARAPGWAKLFHYRILNSERARPLYSWLVGRADEATRITISRILRSIATQEGAPLKDRAGSVLEAADL